ncbi:MAG: hypothetical protein WKF92_01345 [Pyrinomonadaceae bacterium]
MVQSDDETDRPARYRWKDALFFAAVAVFIYSQLFEFPFTPIYFDGDQLIPISNAMRMLDGEVIYRDFFHFAPPGTELLYAGLFSVFGVKIWVVNFVILMLSLAQVGLLWFFSRRVLSGLNVYLPALIFLTIGFRQMGIDGSYRLFSVVLVLAGVAILLNGRTMRNIVIAGALCGMASFFVQPRGVVGIAGIALFLAWENYADGLNFRKLARDGIGLVFSFVLVVILTQLYFAWNGGFDVYYFDIVTFLHKHYPHDPLNNQFAYFSDVPGFAKYLETQSPLSAMSRFIRTGIPVLFYYAIIPLVYLALLIVIWKRDIVSVSPGQKRSLLLLTFAGLALAAGVSAPTAARFYHVAIPGIVIFVWLVGQVRAVSRLAVPCLVMLSLLGISYAVQRQIIAKDYVDFPAGRSAFLIKDDLAKYDWIKKNTEAGEIFYDAHHPNFYFPFHLKNPTPIYLVRDSEYTPKFQVASIVAALERNPPNLIVWEGTYSKNPESRKPGDNLEPLWQFISRNYTLKAEFAKDGEYNFQSTRDTEMWERKK